MAAGQEMSGLNLVWACFEWTDHFISENYPETRSFHASKKHDVYVLNNMRPSSLSKPGNTLGFEKSVLFSKP